jgi:hypothetical protein
MEILRAIRGGMSELTKFGKKLWRLEEPVTKACLEAWKDSKALIRNWRRILVNYKTKRNYN